MDRKKFLSSAIGLSFFPLLKTNLVKDEIELVKKAPALKLTCDPFVKIVEQRIDYVKYVEFKRKVDEIKDAENEIIKIWEVHGICTGIGKCYEGAVNEKPILDCPVNEYLKNNCCPLKVNVLYKKQIDGDKIISQ
jgi:hypothetical protein